jgi:two-component system response regulator LytT|tara:strand:- start:83 stop:295 length:213 start_codon:yes stop_codon:yes gene_type:complete
VVNQSLTSIETDLNPEHFFRLNRAVIVHINAINDIIFHTNCSLKLILNTYSETEIILGRERVKDFKSWID